MAKGSIIPLSTGTYDEAELSHYYYLTDASSAGVKLTIEFWIFLIEIGDTLILVDTGPGDPETWGRKYHHFYDRYPHQNPLAALDRLNIQGRDIDIVINTHLHWNSCQGNLLLPRATIFVQEAEVREALDPVEPHRQFYTPAFANPPWMQALPQTRVIDGEQAIVDGVIVIPMPSHTRGFQCVLVETYRGPILLAGEMLPFLDSWEGRWGWRHIPNGIMQASLHEYYDCFRRIEEINPHYVLPGLDPRVAEQAVYGGQVK
jgi:glyoxylase-like metal-dependent hydrolase (beta-lactamase superfamily II)